MDKKTSTFSMILFMVASPYLIFTYFYIPLLIRNNQNGAYLIPLILIIMGILLVCFLPKKISEINYYELLKKCFFAKILYKLFLVISIILHLFIMIRVISEMFFYNHHYILVTVMIIGSVLLLSRNSKTILINASTILLLTGILLGITPYFLNSEVKKYSYLLPIEISFYWQSLVYGLYFIFETVSFCIFFKDVKGKITRKSLIITNVLIFIFFVLEILQIIVLAGVTYFKDMEFLGYLTFFIQDTITYIGNMGFVYLYLIPLVGLFKSSIQMHVLKDLLKIKSNIISDLIIGLVCTLLIILFFKVKIFIYFEVLLIVNLFCLMVLYFFILINRSEKYEIRF